MKGLKKRIARLERAEPDEQRPALVLLHGVGHDPDSMTGIDGLDDHPRLDEESVADYLMRVNAHLKATRGGVGPLVTFARYGPDDLPDAPNQDATAAML